MNEIASQFLVFFQSHGFWSYLVVAFGLFIAAIGFAAGRRLIGLKEKSLWNLLPFALLLPIWFCIGLIGLVLMLFFKRVRVFFRF